MGAVCISARSPGLQGMEANDRLVLQIKSVPQPVHRFCRIALQATCVNHEMARRRRTLDAHAARARAGGDVMEGGDLREWPGPEPARRC